MILFDIPDIRLFWSEDKRFLSQFKDGKVTQFEPYSKHPVCIKDISFWIPDHYNENNFHSLVQTLAGDRIESITEIDRFQTADQKTSLCYRLHFRHLDRSLTNEEINSLMKDIHAEAENNLKVKVRLKVEN